MSPKQSSLAFDEVQEQDTLQINEGSFEPELVLVKSRSGSFVSSSPEIIRVMGRVTVSF